MTSAVPKSPPLMDVDEFLAWDGDGHQGKLELVDGVVRAMAPANPTHGTIQARLAYLLSRHLELQQSRCRVVSVAGIQPRVRKRYNLRIPDLLVTCSPDVRGDQILPDPLLLIEILSPGNSKRTWDNVWTYVSIPSVQEILVVHSVRIKAELLRKGADGAWPEEAEVIEAGGTLRLTSIGAEFALEEVYRGTYLVS